MSIFNTKEALERAKLMMFINTVNQYIQYNIDNRLTPSVTALQEWIKEKTGNDLPIKDISLILGFMTSNFGMLILFGINQQAEKISEGMLNNRSNLWSYLRSKLPTWLGGI